MSHIYKEKGYKMYWLAVPIFLLLLIYLITLKDKTKNTKIKNLIKKALRQGRIIDTNKISWDDAIQYAKEEGNEFTTVDNMITFYICDKKERKYILMMPNSSGGVIISAYKREARNIFFRLLDW